MYTDKISTKIGDVFICCNDNFITNVYFEGEGDITRPINPHPLLDLAKSELIEYFEGKRKIFTMPIFQDTTEFRQSVYKALLDIDYGTTKSYKDIAIAIGNPKASRAVGNANNKNNIGIVVPCHRVIGSNSAMVGYASGIYRKEFLLTLEKENL